jgi:hypothetical protein
VASTASATIIQRLELKDLQQSASSVVLGRVTDIHYQTFQNRPWTIITLKVEKSLKGSGSGTVRFRIPGGMQTLDGRTLVTKVEGVPEIRLHERAVFFLEAKPPSFAGLLGWNQGLYRLIQNNGVEFVLRSDGTQSPQKLEEFLRDFQRNLIGGTR